MTNAQVALLAAAVLFEGTGGGHMNSLIDTTERLEAWLDSQPQPNRRIEL